MKSRRGLCVWICLVQIVVLGLVSLVHAAIPQKINYQGRLTDSETGEPLVGEVDLMFRIYDNAGDGTLLWSEGHYMSADSVGVVSVVLGSITPIDISFGEEAWLEIEVNGQVLSPRREIVSVPYAFLAAEADLLDGLAADAFADTVHVHDDRYYVKDELTDAGTINLVGNPVDWTKLKGVPGGFADGVDDAGGTGDGHSLDAADGSPTDVVYVDNDGEVGIGTLTPGHSLDVDGDVNLSGDLRMQGTTVVSMSGTGNILIGDGAGAYNTGLFMTAIGDSAGASNQSNLNTLIGYGAGRDHTTGEQNVFLGHLTGFENTTGGHNTHLGAFTGHLSNGSSNTFVGTAAGFNADGDENTWLGAYAGYSNTSGTGNTFLGYCAGFNEMGSNKLYIANGPDPADVLIYGDFSTGRVGLGVPNPTLGRLQVLGGSEAGTYSSSQTGAGVIGFSQDGDGVIGISNNGRAASFVGDVYVSADLGVGKEAGDAMLDVGGAINADSLYMIGGEPVLAVPYTLNTFVGVDAGGDPGMGGSDVTCVGYAAGDNNFGSYNIFVGSYAGYQNGGGERNTVVGTWAGGLLNGAHYNTFIGQNAGAKATTGGENTFLGAESGYWNDGNHNTFVGWGAGATNYTGSGNVCLGYDAGAAEAGSNKLYIANSQDTSSVLIHGDFSTRKVGIGMVGPTATLTVNDNISGVSPTAPGIVIGEKDAISAIRIGSDASNYCRMGWYHPDGMELMSSGRIYFKLNDGPTNNVVFADDGDVGLGTDSPQRRLHVSSDFSNFGMVFIENSNTGDNEASIGFKEGSDADGSEIWVAGVGGWGNTNDFVIGRAAVKMLITPDGNVGIGTTSPGSNKLYVNGSACGTSPWGICSDLKFKEHIEGIGDALGKVLSLRGVTFDWKRDEYPDKNFDEGTHYGCIAQEVEEVLPEVVREGPNGDKAVAYSEIVPVLIESIKAQQDQIEQLRAEVDELRAALAAKD